MSPSVEVSDYAKFNSNLETLVRSVDGLTRVLSNGLGDKIVGAIKESIALSNSETVRLLKEQNEAIECTKKNTAKITTWFLGLVGTLCVIIMGLISLIYRLKGG